ncbi:hypothetical protein GY45DRAFT_1305377 [Cubamyces sp. BRFM 1775]|nr:hypothetical protein GY45DRAFT_1305377 [Cubamyces sp. BRFM 1775]
MSGIAYSALANWDGSLSVSGSQAGGGGGGNTTREPTAAPPSVAGSPGPRPHLRSSAGNVAGPASGGVSRSTPTLASAPHASGSATSASAALTLLDAYAQEMKNRGTATPYNGAAAGSGRRSEDGGMQEAYKLAHQASRSPTRENPPVASSASTNVAEHNPAASRDAQPSMRRNTSPTQPSVSAQYLNAGHTDISVRAFRNFHPEHFVPQTSKNAPGSSSRLGSTQQSTVRPVQEKLAGSHDVVIEDDSGSLLDADGETDHESAASVYTLPQAQNTTRPTQGHDTTVEPRDATDATAVSRSRAPSWERGAQSSRASYSSEFLEAAQHYYVSRSPSIQILDNPPPGYRAPPSETRSRQDASMQPLQRPTIILDHDNLFSLSPLSTPTASPVSVRSVRRKRRRLEKPYVEVPPLPPHRSREAYLPAAKIPVLQDERVDLDPAVQLRLALNQAALNNAGLMNCETSPSTASPERHRRDVRHTASVSPTKKSTRTPSQSLSTISKKRGRPLGSRSKPKGPNSDERHLPTPEPVEVEEPYVHTPADKLEPYFPSVHVDIEDRPMPSAALFLVAFRSFIKHQIKHLPRQQDSGAATPAKVPESPQRRTPIPLPRRSLFRRKEVEAHATTSPTISNTATTAHEQPSRSRLPSPTPPPSTSSPKLRPSPIVIPQNSISPPHPPMASSTSSHSTALIGLDMLADYGSSPPPEEASDSNRTSDNDPSAPRSPPQQMEHPFNTNPAVLHHASPVGTTEFHDASRYSLPGPSGLADMFAAEKALRDAQGGSYQFNGEASESAPGDDLDLGHSYFHPIDIDMHFDGAMADHAWMLEDPPLAESIPAHPNGTIDPSWLSGAALDPAPNLRPDTPPLPETPAAGPSRALMHTTITPKSPHVLTHTPSVSGSQVVLGRAATTPSTDSDSDADQPLSVKRKRAPAEQQPQLPIRLPREMEQESPRRPRRLTERALATYYESDTSDDFRPSKRAKGAGSSKGAGKGQGKGKGKEKERATSDTPIVEPRSFRELAEEPTPCHQCRNTTTREKMRCTAMRDNGTRCGLRFCERCITNRYPEITFDAYAVRFVCPRCQNTCNCTSCCARRGETYISARVGKLPPAGSAEALALAHEVAVAAKSGQPPKIGCGGGGTPLKMDLVGGQYFGTIYGVAGGERMGQGYVGEDSRGIVVRNARRIPKVVAYIGKPRQRTAQPVQALPPAVETDQHIPVEISARVEGSIPVMDPPSSSSHLPSITLPNGVRGSSAGAASDVPPPAEAAPDPRQALSTDIPSPSAPPRKLYIGNCAVLSNSAYVSIDVLVARMEQEDTQDRAQEMTAPSSDPISISSTGGDENPPSDGATGPAPQPQTEDVQWAIALALHALEVDAMKS